MRSPIPSRAVLGDVLRNALIPFRDPLADGLEHAHRWQSRYYACQAVGLMRLAIGTALLLFGLVLYGSGWFHRVVDSAALLLALIYVLSGMVNIKGAIDG